MNPPPLWLKSPAIQELLNLVVDRLDQAELRGSARPSSIALNERSWPSLYKADRESEKEHLWEQLQILHEWGWLSIKPLQAARQPGGYAQHPRISVTHAQALRAAVGRESRPQSAAEQWRQAVHTGLQADPATQALVSGYCIDIPGRSMAETVERLNLLPELADQALLLREVSSRLFWGMSKMLDKRQPMVAAILGMEECPFAESPVQLQVHLPPGGFDGLLFVENLISFERATRSNATALQGLALIYASGFKGSALRLRSPATCSLYYSSRGELSAEPRLRFEDTLFGHSDLPCYFWGDLDWAGMSILAAMRTPFPRIQAWQPGYRPMLAQLLAGQGHPPEDADKQGQKTVAATGCTYADSTLLPALASTGCFVDQEQQVLND